MAPQERGAGRRKSYVDCAGDQIFGVPKYRRTLERLASQRGVELLTHVHLVEVRPERSEAVFENLETREEVVVAYDLLHVTPPQRSPEFTRQSPLAGAGADPDENDQSPSVRDRGLLRGARGGFVDVDRETLQHKRFPNVLSLGDAAALPTAKTGAAVRKQAPVVVENLLAVAVGAPPTAKYDGYTSCPLVVGHDRVVLAEFGYDGSILETFPVDQAKPRYSAWLLEAPLAAANILARNVVRSHVVCRQVVHPSAGQHWLAPTRRADDI